MEGRTEREPASNGKYVLIAHERGSNLYVLASESGNLVMCTKEVLDECYRYSESLTSFSTLVKNLWRKGRENERFGLIPPNSTEDYVEKSIKRIIRGAVRAMDYPPKERVDFFSVPKEIVASLDWIPKKL